MPPSLSLPGSACFRLREAFSVAQLNGQPYLIPLPRRLLRTKEAVSMRFQESVPLVLLR